MTLKIRWSPRAVTDIKSHLNYVDKKWGESISKELLNRIEEVLESITKNPVLYPSFKKRENIHRCVVTSQIVLYYRIKNDVIELITFWDTRQNPENLNL